MLKTVATVFRGLFASAEEEFADRHALMILDQQIREAAEALEGSRRAFALALAQDETESRRLETLRGKITDIEERAVEALRAGRDDLAREAAEALAALEADQQAAEQARAAFASEIHDLRNAVADATRRLADLERGRRIAHAAEAVRRLRTRSTAFGSTQRSALGEAEATLQRLRERQLEAAAAERARCIVENAARGVIAERLERAGFGQRTRPTAACVMERLRDRALRSSPIAIA